MAKILLVDDDTTFCLMLKTWLTKRGFEVENAFSCREALAKLKGTKYDVVLTDLRLPDEDGIYLLKNIKASTPEVQVILMTGYADIQTAVLAMKLGAFDYVAKPVIPDEILKKIQDTLEQTAVPEQKKRTKKPQSVHQRYESGSRQTLRIYSIGSSDYDDCIDYRRKWFR